LYNPETIAGPSLLLSRIISVKKYRDRYCDLIDSLSTTLLDEYSVGAYIDSVTNYIIKDVSADHRKFATEIIYIWNRAVDQFEEHISDRMDYIADNIDEFRSFESIRGVYINEICNVNESGLRDERGDRDPWIELYNVNSFPVSIGGWYLTDLINLQTKWELPDVEIPADGYLILWLDNEPSEGNLHGNFSLGEYGGYIGLFDGNEEPYWGTYYPGIDFVFYDIQGDGVSYQRFYDDINQWGYGVPTPNGNNFYDIEENNIATPDLFTLNVYPNPFNAACQIEVSEPSDVKIYDISGNIVAEMNISGGSSAIWSPEEYLSSGIYLISVVRDGNVESRKVIYMK